MDRVNAGWLLSKVLKLTATLALTFNIIICCEP